MVAHGGERAGSALSARGLESEPGDPVVSTSPAHERLAEMLALTHGNELVQDQADRPGAAGAVVVDPQHLGGGVGHAGARPGLEREGGEAGLVLAEIAVTRPER